MWITLLWGGDVHNTDRSLARFTMPHYEFFCQECEKYFSKILSVVDYEEGEVLCPHCGGKKVERRWSAFP
jgi:putative FmdB family regulatory protein